MCASNSVRLLGREHYDYSPQFPLKLMNKDFGLILAKAAEVGAPIPLAAADGVLQRQLESGESQLRIVCEIRPEREGYPI